MKKLIISLLLVLTLCFGAFVLAACNDGSDNANSNNNATDTSATTSSNSERIGFSAATAASMLGSVSVSDDATPAALDATVQTALEEQLTTQINLIESLIDRSGFTVKEDVSTVEDYEYALTVTLTDLLGESSSYTLSYNATPVAENDKDKDFDDVDEIEQTFAIEGELSDGTTTYEVYGLSEYEEETERGGTETETSFELVAYNKASGIGIKIEQSNETETSQTTESEEEYEYSLYTGATLVQTVDDGVTEYDLRGTLQYHFSIEYEEENGETSLEVTLLQGGLNGTLVDFDKEVVGSATYAKVTLRYDTGNGTVSASVRVLETSAGYTFDFIYGDEAAWQTIYNALFPSTDTTVTA